MLREVVRLPDHVLKRRAVEVERVDDTARALAQDLVETMRASPACVGLAAPQIGVSLRAFVVDVTGHRKARSCHRHGGNLRHFQSRRPARLTC